MPAPRTRRLPVPDRESVLVLAHVLALGAVAVVLGRLLDDGPLHPDLPLPWWSLAVAFAVTEAVVVNVQARREAQAISLSELPLVLGLVFADPHQLLVGRLLGSAAVYLWQRRAPLKLSWNLAHIAAQTTIAVAVLHAVVGLGPGQVVEALGVLAAAVVANALGGLALTLVIAVYEGMPTRREVLRDLVRGDSSALTVVGIGLVCAVCLQATLLSAWLLVPVAVRLLVFFRDHARLTERHLALERMLGFTRAVNDSPENDQVIARVLGEAKHLLKAERVEAVFVGAQEGTTAHVALGVTDRLSRTEQAHHLEDPLLLRVVEDGDQVLVPRGTRDPEQRAWLERYAAREAVVVPLRGGTGVLGALVVLDRMGDVRTFDTADLALAESVAAQAGTAMQNGTLTDQLRHDAQHDALTGLPNRAQLQRRTTAALDRVLTGRSPGAAVMIVDLNAFKEVNDALGHQQGDHLLTEVGRRLAQAAGTSALVARLGGDEFAVLAEDVADEDAAVRLGRRLVHSLEQPVAVDDLQVEITGSIGIALAPRHGTEPAGLLNRADLAMADAKASTRGLRVFDDSLASADPRRLAVATALRAAIAEEGLELHVQPQAEAATGRVVGVEALVRWTHPELGRVGPDEFIPVAERSGLIGPLTTFVLDRSLAAVADWRRRGVDLTIAVNLSSRSLHDVDLVDEVQRLLRRHDVPSDRLTLEVTEGSVMTDPARAIGVLLQLRELGCHLSVDDFGTGHSSLSYLKQLPVHEVKIDKSFVLGLRADGEDLAIVRTVVDLAGALGLTVVAEGVEDQATWDLVAGTGCDVVQGWHLSRPMPAGELTAWLAARASRPARPRLRAVGG